MIKLVALLTVVSVVWTFVTFTKVESELVSGNMENTPSVTSIVVPTPTTLGASTNTPDLLRWKDYTNEKLGLRLMHPEGIQIKTNPDESVIFSKDSLNITISRHSLSSKDSVNTIAEQDINSKLEKEGSSFKLIDTISPIAIGSQTGVSFTAEDQGREITYFYIPQGFNYLKIINKTEEIKTGGQISLSDDIIYSLEITEK